MSSNPVSYTHLRLRKDPTQRLPEQDTCAYSVIIEQSFYGLNGLMHGRQRCRASDRKHAHVRLECGNQLKLGFRDVYKRQP